MIYEYALEPELVATWTNRSDLRYFIPCFGLGQGRIVSQYPKRWKRLVWNASRATDDLSRTRLEVLLARMSETMVRRSDIHWDNDSPGWMENAECEHERQPFHAILARRNPRFHTQVLTEDNIDENSPGRWTVQHSRLVSRAAQQMAVTVAPLLRCSSIVIFIDPHFRPGTLRYRNSFTAFFEQLVRNRPCTLPHRIEVVTGATNSGTEEFFRQECKIRLRRCIPAGVRILVRRLEEKPNGDRLHNRYILTDLGGVTFGTGLDESSRRETDDVTLMSRELYEKRWSQYRGNPPPGFDQMEPTIEIVGARRIR